MIIPYWRFGTPCWYRFQRPRNKRKTYCISWLSGKVSTLCNVPESEGINFDISQNFVHKAIYNMCCCNISAKTCAISIHIAQFTPSATKVTLELETQLAVCSWSDNHLRVQTVQGGNHRRGGTWSAVRHFFLRILSVKSFDWMLIVRQSFDELVSRRWQILKLYLM